MALWYALNDPLLQLEWTLDSLLQDDKPKSKVNNTAQPQRSCTAPNTKQAQQSQSIKVNGPRWAAPAGNFDIIETTSAFELVTDAPGFDPADISVELKEGVLTISGMHESPKEEKQQQQQQEQQQQELQQEQVQGQQQEKQHQPPSSVQQESAVKIWCKERRQYHFNRSFKLPDNTKAEDIVARLDKGVLTVHVPKLPPAPKPQPQRITVQGGPAVAA